MQAASSTNAFQCPMCNERYNDSDHAPKTLPCGHSYCSKCLSSLPTNCDILNAMPPLTPPVVVQECSMCKKTKRPVIMHCETCNLHLCLGHSETHQDDHEDHVLHPAAQTTTAPAVCSSEAKGEVENVVCKMLPCRTELDCRRVIVAILKQTRGVANWNGPDDEGNQFNWNEELPLGEWNGLWGRSRIQVDWNGMITTLLLHNLGMRGMFPDSIGCLTSLTKLDININQLTQLPDSIGNMTSLTALDVGSNPITSTQAGKDEVKRRFGRSGLNLYGV